eukprot:Nk52_evm3s293 gene=Nk52_evmTU3s293
MSEFFLKEETGQSALEEGRRSSVLSLYRGENVQNGSPTMQPLKNPLGGRDKNLMPDWISLSLMLFSAFLVNSNYFIIFPTIRDYSNSLGADETFFGWVLSVQSLVQLVTLWPIDYYTRFSYRWITIILAVLGAGGNVLYALGRFLDTKWALFVGSAFIGCSCSVWIIYRKYVSDATGPNTRTKVFSWLMFASASGYSGGPLLGVSVYYIDFQIGPLTFDKYTNPGWLMAVLWVAFALCMWLLFTEPERTVDDDTDATELIAMDTTEEEKNKGKKMNSSSSLENLKLLKSWRFRLAVLVCASLPMQAQFLLGVLETSITVVGPEKFDWSTFLVGIFLSVIALLVIPVGYGTGRISSFVSDRLIIFVAILSCMFGSLLITEWPFIPFTLYQYVPACVLLFVGQGLLDSVAYSLGSKMIPSYATGRISKANLLLLLNLGVSIGRPMGPLWAAESTQPDIGIFGVGVLCLGVMVFALFLHVFFYPLMLRWDQHKPSNCDVE